MRIKKSSVTATLKYVACFAFMIITARAETAGGLSPFGLGTFVGLVFAGQNLLILSPMYIAASLIAHLSWQSAVIALTPCVVLFVAYFLHHKLDKKLGFGAINAYALISQIPYVVLYAKTLSIYQIITTLLISQVFVYIAVLALYALLSRGLRYKLTIDESIAVFVTAGVTALSLYSAEVYGFNFFYLVFGFSALVSAYVFSSTFALYLSVVTGLGCAFAGGGVQMIAVTVLLTSAVIAFKNTNAVASALAMLLTDAVLFYYFDAHSGYGYINVIALAVGALLYLVIPKRYKSVAFSPMLAVSNARAGKTVVNKNRQELSVRLYSLSSVFEDMQNMLTTEVGVLPDVRRQNGKIAKEISSSFCGVCENHDSCFSSLGADTSGIIEEILEGTRKRNKVSIIDMPPFITGRCRRLNGLISVINDNLDRARVAESEEESADRGRQMIAVQMGGVAEILDNLAGEFKKPLSFDGNREKLIVDELAYVSVSCREVMVYGEGGDVNVTLLLAAADADNPAVLKVLTRIMRIRLEKVDEFSAEDNFVSVHFAPSPRYGFICGEAFRAKREGDLSGDARCVKKISKDRVVFALSDGMGAGKGAEALGSRAAQMVENFFEAGFSAEVVTALSNRLLTVKSDDGFSTLDMAVLNLNTGATDFIKLGATYTVLKRGDVIEIINGSALPVGVVDKVKPNTVRYILEPNDVIILLSDGVTDVVKEGELSEFLLNYKGINPQALAEDVVKLAEQRGANDDITAIVARVFMHA